MNTIVNHEATLEYQPEIPGVSEALRQIDEDIKRKLGQEALFNLGIKEV